MMTKIMSSVWRVLKAVAIFVAEVFLSSLAEQVTFILVLLAIIVIAINYSH